MALKVGDSVSINRTSLTGIIDGAVLNETTLEIQYRVSYKDYDGEDQQRFFEADQITAE